MVHQETVRIVSGARTAVLFIHGIVGTPNHFRDVLPLVQLVPEGWSFHNLLLDGHGGTVEEFSRSSMRKWKAQVWQSFETLSREHEHIILFGHSMGTLFAIQLAVQFPEKVSQLFLFAVPLRPCLRLFGVTNMLKLVFGRIREDDPQAVATRDACGVDPTVKLWMYLGWIPRFLELFSEIRRTERVLAQLTVPCTAYQSKRDELVCNTARKLLDKSGRFKIADLHDSSHFYYAPRDRERICRDFEDIIKHTPA